MKEFLNNKQAAALIGVCPQTMSKIRNSKGFVYTRLGRTVLINKDFLLDYIREHRKIRY